MTIKKYQVSLKHDNGKIRITTVATSKQSAIDMIMKAEGCPECAISNVNELN